MKAAATVAAAVLALSLPLLSPAPGVAAGSADRLTAPVDPSASKVTIELTGMMPSLIEPSSTLTLSGTVHNGSSEAIAAAELDFQLDNAAEPYRDRGQLSAWQNDDEIDAWGWTVQAADLAGPIAPGVTVPFELTIPASRLALPSGAGGWGAYPCRLDVTTRTGVVAVFRTFVMWQPKATIAPITMAAAMPLLSDPTHRIAEAGESKPPDNSIAAAAAAARTGAEAGIDLVVDPALLTEEAPDSDRLALTAQLKNAAEAVGVWRLPWSDQDVAALAHGQAAESYRYASDWGQRALADAKIADAGLIAWPAGGQLDATTAEFLAESAPPAAVIVAQTATTERQPREARPGGTGSPSAEPTDRADPTPEPATARTAIDAPNASLPALRVDSRISSLLADAAPSSVAGHQRLLAELATMAAASPDKTKTLFVLADRNAAADPATFVENLEILASVPWLTRTSTADLLHDPAAGTLTPESAKPASAELDEASVRELDARLVSAINYSEVTAQPAATLAPLAEAALTPTSMAYRTQPTPRATAVQSANRLIAASVDTVSVRQASGVNVLAASSRIPVSVANSGTEEITVTVRLESPDRRLVVDDSAKLTVPAGTEARAMLRVRAVANGDVDLQVLALNDAGQEVAPRSEITVRVRADWEDLGTLAAGLLFAALLVMGLFRSRRRKRKARAQGGT